ncbi:unnamed protein product, partial [Scytosiphon promiscuus]
METRWLLPALASIAVLATTVQHDVVAFTGALTVGSSFRPPRIASRSSHLKKFRRRRESGVERQPGRSTTATRMSQLRTFEANEIQLQRFIGELGFVEITDWEYNRKTSPVDPTTPSRTVNSSGTTVRLFEARTYGNVKVVLKEFLPRGLKLAYRELEINDRLIDAWQSKNGSSGRAPVLALLGSLVADESFKSRRFLEQWVSKFPSLPVPATGSVWLVYRWEGLYTFASFPGAKQESEFFDALNPASKTKRRAAFVKEMMRGAASALAFMHEAGMVHRSLGAPSLRVNTLDERYPKQLEVLLSDFGFSCRLSEIDDETIRRASSSGAASPFAVSDFLFREDLYSLGYVFLELIFGAFCDPEPRNSPRRYPCPLPQLQKPVLLALARPQDYCLTEPSWEPAVEVLDDNQGSGWGLATALLQARRTTTSSFETGG